LKAVKEKDVSDSELKYLLLALPYDTVDEFDLQLSVVENRIATLESVDDPSVSCVKKIGTMFFKKNEKRYRGDQKRYA
jgi:hypothetical protein